MRLKKHLQTVLALVALFVSVSPAQSQQFDRLKLVGSARKQIGITVSYDPSYRSLRFPNGDVPLETGVCADVIVRALSDQAVDLQKEVHEDMRRNFSQYPNRWGLKKPDPNIDHRRVLNLMTYFTRKGYARPISNTPADYQPGDIVTWELSPGITHIGIVSNRSTSRKIPLIIHNIGAGTQEEDILFQCKIIGLFRFPSDG